MTNNRRLPAEWEKCGAVLLSWPHKDSDWNYILDEAYECYINLVNALISEVPVIIVAPDIAIPKSQLAHLNEEKLMYWQINTNDTWARDFGPITTFEYNIPVICDFKFNGWGLKYPACFDNLITGKLASAGIITAKVENHLGFVLEGGSIDSDGNGSILTTSECLLSLNRNGNLSKESIESYLKYSLGAYRIMWIDNGFLAGDDTDSHVDTLARFAPHNTILYVKCDNPSDIHYKALKQMENELQHFRDVDGMPYNLMGLPMTDPIFDETGSRLPATYANFFVTPTAVFMPTYNQPDNDRRASETIRKAFPGYKVISVDCRTLIKQHGSLHCVTMQLPSEILSI